MGDCCRALLSEGLDLCVRARKLDAAVTDAMEAGGVGLMERPVQGTGTRCLTPALWVMDQYDTDAAEWERRARHHLTQGCPNPSDTPRTGGDDGRRP